MVCVDDLVEFVRNNIPSYDSYSDEQIQWVLNQHIKFGTISSVFDGDKIIGLLRINVNGTVAVICDLIVEKGYDTKQVIRQLVANMWPRFPYLKYFQFYRILKYPLKKGKIYTIKRLMKVK